MTEAKRNKTWAHIQMGLIAAAFGVPLLLAAWMYYGGAMVPDSRTNNGALLQPFVRIADQLPNSPLHKSAPDQWLMVYVNEQPCAEECAQGLYRLRQMRLMLGDDMKRVARIFLHGDTPPDTVLVEEQHAGLITIADKELAALLEGKRPAELQSGGCFLIDPLGNLVMYFEPGLNPNEVVGDIEHLLKLSRIG